MTLTMTEIRHVPVLLAEIIEALNIRQGGRYVDCTLGGGGHASAILEKCQPGGELLGIDSDPEAIKLAQHRLYDYFENTVLINDNFSNLEHICNETGFTQVNGILFDLGLSSLQLDTAWRGFSFQQSGPLDMRFNPDEKLTAADIVNKLPELKLAQLIRIYGEEPSAARIARNIVNNRPITDTAELAVIVSNSVIQRPIRIHPATRTFQALRIAVNRELDYLTSALEQTINCLAVGGRLAIISYHSLEDRIVKNFMSRESRGCICPSDIPECRCNHQPKLQILTKNVLVPTDREVDLNPRSRSAKLRVAQRI
ncbi:MAG: 16S rRNA (cytosine(1402)-N(4))-methyltransferase RsmH [Dehalococcoidia bacterium]|nr:16S rRNA (cytosine(1402)-N(4))-methyltransferase RsmH [Dehalococcoidia bacterium]MDD5494792.1 16S rRNA (cytosine(1402)-N(4))-methyltransferase RsmH [Dehalococcoidia bacterium]